MLSKAKHLRGDVPTVQLRSFPRTLPGQPLLGVNSIIPEAARCGVRMTIHARVQHCITDPGTVGKGRLGDVYGNH